MNKRLLVIIGIILIAVAIPVTVFLVKQQQQYKGDAAVPGGAITAFLDPDTATFNVGSEFNVAIKLDTKGLNASAAKFYLYYNYTGEQPEVEILDQNTSEAGIQVEQNQPSFTYAKNEVTQNTTTKTVATQLSIWALPNYIRTEAGSPITIATIHFKGNQPVNSFQLKFNPNNSYGENVVTVMSSSGVDAEDQLNIPSDGTYTIQQVSVDNPAISSVEPGSSKVGESVTISGSNFGTAKGTVKFGDISASDITSWESGSIIVKVPTGLSAGNVQLTVTTSDNKTSAAANFTVSEDPPVAQNPSINGISPSSGKASEEIAISGANFGGDKGKVKFGSKEVSGNEITEWAANKIKVKIPSGVSAGTIKITVITADNKTSNGSDFEVKSSGDTPQPSQDPAISSLNPSNGKVGDSITIIGSNFGATEGTVKFGTTTVPATNVDWANSSITAKVPAGLSAGTVKVTVITSENKTSNGLDFEVKSSENSNNNSNQNNSSNNSSSNNSSSSSNNSSSSNTSSGNSAANIQLKVTNVSNNQTLTSKRPLFRGTAAPNSIVTVTVRSKTITGTTTADGSGNWSWTPTEDLEEGTHTITIASGGSTSMVSFTINSSQSALPASGETIPTTILTITSFLILAVGLVWYKKGKRKLESRI